MLLLGGNETGCLGLIRIGEQTVITGSGGIVLSGEALLQKVLELQGSSGPVLSGEALKETILILSKTGSGGFILSGSAEFIKETLIQGTGGIVSSGVAKIGDFILVFENSN